MKIAAARKEKAYATEAELVAAFCALIDPARWARNPSHAPRWTQYHETAGWDLLLVNPDGVQIGIEAKLSLNPKVLDQALPGRWGEERGPDYRAVLVPADGLQHHMTAIARHLGIVVIRVRPGSYSDFQPSLPDEKSTYGAEDWPNWCPAERCAIPDYVPDVSGGKASPVQLSPWKIKAIKLLVLLDRNGAVTRQDMKAIQISASRWTDHWHGFLSPGPDGGYIRNGRTPDLRTQHPKNWAEIESDFDRWSRGAGLSGPTLLRGAA